MYCCPLDFASPAFDESVALRDAALRKPLGLSFTVEQLAEEWSSWHLGAYDEHSLLSGILVLRPISDEEVKMRQVAVAESFRGQGIGSLLVAYSEVFAKRQGFSLMTLHARQTAVPFYTALGYEVVGDPFEEVSLPHRKMKKSL